MFDVAFFLFWAAFTLIVYTYLIFPLIIAFRGFFFPRPVKINPKNPNVSIIIVAHNEADVIIRKLQNIFQLDYPQSLLEIIVASDGSDDRTEELVRGYGSPQVKLLSLPRQGKNRALNAAVAIATGEVLVFSDADSLFEKDTLRYLTAPFSDPDVGGVGGDYRYTNETSGNDGERTYWHFDRALKSFQSRAGSITSATGQIYALRRSLFKPVPTGVTDDFFTSTQATAAHRRLIFEPRASAYGPIARSGRQEFYRKVRVINRGLWSVWQMREILSPAKYGFYAVQVLSHKVLRRLMAVPLLIITITAPLLFSQGGFYAAVTLIMLALHGSALIGFIFETTSIGEWKMFSLPFYFDMVNAATLVALCKLIQRKRYDIWSPQRARVNIEQHDTMPAVARTIEQS